MIAFLPEPLRFSNVINEALPLDRTGNTYYDHDDGTDSVEDVPDVSGNILEICADDTRMVSL